MREIGCQKSVLWPALALMLCATAAPSCVFADDKESTTSQPKAALTNLDSPVPLTERERWMLDRIGQLEKCRAELEGESQTASINADFTGPGAPNERAADSPTSVAAGGKSSEDEGIVWEAEQSPPAVEASASNQEPKRRALP